MTLPHEEVNSLVYAGKFLFDIAASTKYKPVAKEARKIAAMILRHYPVEGEIRREWKKEGKANGG